MGSPRYDVKIQDLPIGERRSFKVEDQYLSNLFTRKSRWNVNTALDLVRQLADLAGREVAFDLYAGFNQSPVKKNRISPHDLFVPEIGTPESVPAPYLTRQEDTIGDRPHRKGKTDLLLVPILFAHTHLSYNSSPSEMDLRCAKSITERDYYFHNSQITVHTHCIEVIAATKSNDCLFYRFTGDDENYWRFKNKYDQAKLWGNQVADLMNSSGAFIAYWHCSGRDGRQIRGKSLDALVELFPFTIEITRRW